MTLEGDELFADVRNVNLCKPLAAMIKITGCNCLSCGFEFGALMSLLATYTLSYWRYLAFRTACGDAKMKLAVLVSGG